jgi:hypothetical protein
MHRAIFHRLSALMVMWLLGGCAYGFSDHKTLSAEPAPPASTQMSFVFGYIDMEDADPGLDWVTLQQLAPVAKDPDMPTRAKDGIFYLENLAAGSYQVYDFGGRGGGFFAKGRLWAAYPVSFPVSRQSGFLRVKVDKPGVYFLGSYKYVSVSGNRLTTNYVYDLEPLKAPTEKETLQRLLPTVKGTAWEGRLAEHLRKLK